MCGDLQNVCANVTHSTGECLPALEGSGYTCRCQQGYAYEDGRCVGEVVLLLAALNTYSNTVIHSSACATGIVLSWLLLCWWYGPSTCLMVALS